MTVSCKQPLIVQKARVEAQSRPDDQASGLTLRDQAAAAAACSRSARRNRTVIIYSPPRFHR